MMWERSLARIFTGVLVYQHYKSDFKANNKKNEQNIFPCSNQNNYNKFQHERNYSTIQDIM